MKLWVLMENTTTNQELSTEHGLSFYIEVGDHKLLFDMGQSNAFASNAREMGVDLSAVNVAVLSHGHYDHSGGIQLFLEKNTCAPVYLHKEAFGQQFHGESHYIGIPTTLHGNPRLIPVEEEYSIGQGLHLYSCNENPRTYPTNSDGLTVKENNLTLPDTFLHEQYLMIEDQGRKILISGCSHKGILNIMEWFAPDILIGGFHFMNADISTGQNEVLDHAAHILSQYHTQYYTCHCTGLPQYDYLKEKMGDQLCYLSTGNIVKL